MKQMSCRKIAPPLSALIGAAGLLAACGGGGVEEALPLAQAQAAKETVVIGSKGPNAVSTWNEIAFNTVSVPASPSGLTPSERMPRPVDIVTLQLAVYDAVIAIAGTHQPYAIRPASPGLGAGPVAMEAAAIEAAYQVLKALFPSRGDKYEDAHASAIAALPDGTAKSLGMGIGQEVAAGMVALRANDGRETPLPAYVPGSAPGDFRGLNPVNRNLPLIRPFATLSHQQFRVAPPYALNSSAYAADLNEVKLMGSAGSAKRSAAQTETARFHTEFPDAFWPRNLRQFAMANVGLADNARLLALLLTAQSDAIGSCFESKYHYGFWRPSSAIRLADTDGNALTEPDPAWTPVLPTPNHPEYPAAHGCASGSVMEVLRSFYGTKNVAFDFDSNATGSRHHYARTDDLLREIRDARVWGGMHFRSSVEIGAEQGKDVAKWVLKQHFRPLD